MKTKLCLVCGARKDLTKHHLTDSTLKKAEKYGANAFVEEITLCNKCHELVEYEKRKMKWSKKLAIVKKEYYDKGFNDCMERGISSRWGVNK